MNITRFNSEFNKQNQSVIKNNPNNNKIVAFGANSKKIADTFGEGIIGTIRRTGSEFIYNEKGHLNVQNICGSASFAAIWTNVILGSMNMAIRPIVMLMDKEEEPKKSGETTNNNKVQSEESKKKFQAKLYTAGRMFMQEAFGLAATAVFVFVPIKEKIGLAIGKLITRKDAEAQKSFAKYTVQKLKELGKAASGAESATKTAAKLELENLPKVIKGAKGLGDAIAIITALSIMGPALNNVLVNPMLRAAKKPLAAIGIDVEIPEQKKK